MMLYMIQQKYILKERTKEKMGGRVGDEIYIIVCAFSWLFYELHPFDSAVEPR